jgi:hypothetical protein
VRLGWCNATRHAAARCGMLRRRTMQRLRRGKLQQAIQRLQRGTLQHAVQRLQRGTRCVGFDGRTWAHSGALGTKSQAGALQSAGACRVLQHVAPRCNMSHRVATCCRHLLGL